MNSNKSQLVKIFGSRMKDARELCNLTQRQAAKAFGYSNTTYLSKIEKGEYTNSVKPELLIKAAQIYEVSCDYLLGLTDEWERDPQIAQEKHIEGWLFTQWQTSRAIELNAIKNLSKRIVNIENKLNELVPYAKNCHASLLDFIRLNPRFEDDMKGGAKLQSSIIEMDIAATKAKMSLNRYKQDTLMVQTAMPELPLFSFMVFR